MFRRVPALVSAIKRKKMTELTKDTKQQTRWIDQAEFAPVQIYRSLLTFFSSLSSSRYFKFPNSTQQQKKTYHKAIKQSQTVYEQSPNHLVRHHVPTATDKGTPSRNQDLGRPSADFGVFKYAWTVTQKLWNEAENGVWGSRVLLFRHALPTSLLLLRKKPIVLQSNILDMQEVTPPPDRKIITF